MTIKQMIALDRAGHYNNVTRKGLKGIVDRGMFNREYENCEFWKKKPATKADVAMACHRRGN